MAWLRPVIFEPAGNGTACSIADEAENLTDQTSTPLAVVFSTRTSLESRNLQTLTPLLHIHHRANFQELWTHNVSNDLVADWVVAKRDTLELTQFHASYASRAS